VCSLQINAHGGRLSPTRKARRCLDERLDDDDGGGGGQPTVINNNC